MKNNRFLIPTFLIAFLLGTGMYAHAQYGGYKRSFSRASNRVSIGGGLGYTTYRGDIGADKDFRKTPTKKVGFQFSIDQRFGEVTRFSHMFGFTLNGIMGTIQESDFKLNGRFHNFQTPYKQVEVLAKIHFGQLLNMNSRSPLSPFVFVGVGALFFDAYLDLYDANGKFYYLWPNDRSIRDLPYDINNPQKGVLLERDYVFETEVDSLHVLSHTALIIPVGAGIEYNINSMFKANVQMSGGYTFNDDLDGKNNPGPENRYNDIVIYTSANLYYNMSFVSSKYKRRRFKSRF